MRRGFRKAARGDRKIFQERLANDANGTKAVWIADLPPHEAAPAIGAMIDQGMGAMKKTLERPT